MKILAIDDNRDNLLILKAMINDIFPDILILSALNGKKGLELAVAEDPDVILLDVIMPEMDGFEVCKKLKADKRLRDIPVVFITALKGDRESRVCALESGADAFLSKPVEETELTAQIRAMIKIKEANIEKRDEKKRLSSLVESQNRKLKENYTATLNLLEDLKKEVEVRKKSEEKQRAILRTAMDGFWLTDMQGRILEVNDTYCRMSGYGEQELLSMRVADLEAVETEEDARRRIKKLMISGEDRFESKHRRKDGSTYDVEVSIQHQNIDGGRMVAFFHDITERKKAEEDLRKSEGTYRALVGSLPDIVMRFDREGRHLFVSENASKVINLRPEEFIGKTHRELGFREDQCRFWEECIRKVFDRSEPLETEYVFDGKNGTRIYNWRLMPERDGKGVVMSVLSLNRDITEHRLIEENYQMLFREMLDGFAVHEIICDKDGNPVDYRFIAVNPAFERMTGINAENVVGKTILEAIPGTERHWIETYGKVALTGEPAFFENYSGELKKYFKVAAFRSAPKQFACIITDITESKQKERLQALSSEILGILNKPLALHDMINSVLYTIKNGTGFDAVGIRLKSGSDFPYLVQDGFSNDFLLSEDSLFERDMDDVVCKDANGDIMLQCTCGLVISGKTDPSSPLFTAGGSFWTNNSFPLLDLPAEQDPRYHPRNKCIYESYASIALIPIRENHQTIGLLQLNNREKNSLTLDMILFLEGIATRIGVALMHRQAEEEKASLELQLRESQKMEAVGQLAGGISHDFNNLLSVINGYSQMLLMDPDLKTSSRLNAEEILKSGERASALTRQLLLFSRRHPSETRIINLNAIISGVNKMLRRLVPENIDMKMTEQQDLWQVKADPGNIEQVIMNLTVNARDAMPAGGTLTIETRNVEIDGITRIGHHEDIKSGLYVMFSVTDTGYGMDEEVRKHIFEPFFTTKEAGKGTGLGLATVYGIVKQSNAHIDVQSETGKGTKFRIYFPRAEDDDLLHDEKDQKTDMPKGSGTILLAEDEECIRLMLQDFLQSIGYDVLISSNGKEALELVEKHRGKINLLITDVVMPGMNGFELMEKIKVLMPETKLLFMSGYTNPTDTIKMMKVCGNLIEKPIHLDSLAVKIREILG
ncbi:MAG: PAS domain S-box protein [Victivallales bacterium]